MRDVLTVAGTDKPQATAFLANRPAANNKTGLDVLVQEVMEAMAMDPWRSLDPSAKWAEAERRSREMPKPPFSGASDRAARNRSLMAPMG